MQNFLKNLKIRIQSGAHLFGIPSKWKIIFWAMVTLSFLGIAFAYYTWYQVAYGEDTQPTTQITKTTHTFDQKKLQEMISDLELREQTVFGGSKTGATTTLLNSNVDPRV